MCCKLLCCELSCLLLVLPWKPIVAELLCCEQSLCCCVKGDEATCGDGGDAGGGSISRAPRTRLLLVQLAGSSKSSRASVSICMSSLCVMSLCELSG